MILAWLVWRGWRGVVCGGQRCVAVPDKRSVGEEVVVATQIVPLCGTPARIDCVLRLEEGKGGVRWKGH